MRLLVVEDDERLSELMGRGLREEGAAVDIAPTGEEALSLVEAVSYDAVVLDVMLPGIDGFETCRRIRAEEVWTPVLMLTALADVAHRVRGLDSGADDYLGKPFAFSELLARLRALARREPSARPTVLEAAGIKLDPAARRVTREGQDVHLSPKEFALLWAFMRHPDEVLSRLQLLESAWDFAYDNRSNVVDQYVRYLRDKVDRPFGKQTIETVRGVGYRLVRD
jgi:two-component system, OmpR family, response regulator